MHIVVEMSSMVESGAFCELVGDAANALAKVVLGEAIEGYNELSLIVICMCNLLSGMNGIGDGSKKEVVRRESKRRGRERSRGRAEEASLSRPAEVVEEGV